MTFRVYVRTFEGQVSAKTITADASVAAEAFAALVNATEHDGQKLAVALTYKNRQIAFHRFDRQPGDADYWRGRLAEIPWPSQVGRPNEMDGGKRIQVYLDDESLTIAARLGNGNVSEGIRMALKQKESSAELVIQMNYVYENEAGEQRLVVSVDHGKASPVAIWRTPDPDLPKGAKAQGSATVASFRRWAIKMRKATTEDWNAFHEIERRRRDSEAVRRIKQSFTK